MLCVKILEDIPAPDSIQDPVSVAEENTRICRDGRYRNAEGIEVRIGSMIEAAIRDKRSIRPDDPIGRRSSDRWPMTEVIIMNATTLAVASPLAGSCCLVLNFANGIVPGGGYLHGARAQEESLCRAGALHAVLEGDPMYAFHRAQHNRDSSDWAIYTPRVPFFRDGANRLADRPFFLDIITCAAPIKDVCGGQSERLLDRRIGRVYGIASSFSYETLVLGAWGCGAFGNNPFLTAESFRRYLEGEFSGCFRRVIFPILDVTVDRRFLNPFIEVFCR